MNVTKPLKFEFYKTFKIWILQNHWNLNFKKFTLIKNQTLKLQFGNNEKSIKNVIQVVMRNGKIMWNFCTFLRSNKRQQQKQKDPYPSSQRESTFLFRTNGSEWKKVFLPSKYSLVVQSIIESNIAKRLNDRR